jgi:hypothetical protein
MLNKRFCLAPAAEQSLLPRGCAPIQAGLIEKALY